MTQPSVWHRVYFAVLLSTLSMALPEVITMNEPIPWIRPITYVLGYPVYGLHILVLGGLMYAYGRIGIVTIMSYGGLFGLYEAYLIKQVWNPNWGAELTVQVGGVRVMQTLMLVFFLHPVLAFLIPLVIAELFLARPGRARRALPFLRSKIGMFISVIAVAVWLGLVIGANLARHGGRAAFAASVVLVAVVAALGAVWVWAFKGKRFDMGALMPRGKGLWIMAGLLVVEYLVGSRLIRPEAMPTKWAPHLIVLGIYAFFVILILLWRSPETASDLPEARPVNAPAAPWWLALAAAGIFLLIAWLHAPAKEPGGVVAIVSFLGGAIVNLGFLVVCFFVGAQRWLRRGWRPSERSS